MELAITHPDRVATLQLHGTWAKTNGYASLYLGYLKRLLETGGLDLYYEGAILYLFPPQFFIDNPDMASAILKGMKVASSPYAGLLGQLEANLTHDVADRLGAIVAPTLVTVGELDMCLPPHYSIEIHHAIAGSELHIFPGGSHLVGVQDPESFNKVTLAWLDRQIAAGHG
jgi:pimeloyl-ACP methyl ester carboxylesterase